MCYKPHSAAIRTLFNRNPDLTNHRCIVEIYKRGSTISISGQIGGDDKLGFINKDRDVHRALLRKTTNIIARLRGVVQR